MKLKIMRKWVRALRSGKFKQGKGALLDTRGRVPRYCCLGVLCELHRRSTKRFKWEDERYDGSLNVLPESVMKWAGLSDPDPTLIGVGQPQDAAVMNDTGKSFKTIADAIERTQKARVLQ